MNILEETVEKVQNLGIYQAQIIEVNDTVKNGLYKVRVWPFHVDIEDKYLPLATSAMTVNNKHENLYVDEFVWVFLTNGDSDYPVIFARCNWKDNYPDSATGTQPSFYSSITADNAISEATVQYSGDYNTITSYTFGDGTKTIYVDIDEENKQIVLYSDIWQLIMSKDGNLHMKFDNMFFKVSTAFNLHIADNIIKVSASGITMENGSGKKIEIKSDGITMTGTTGKVFIP